MRRRVVSEEAFAVKYDGEALADHRMDVKTLAPALMSLAEAIQTAQRILDPTATPVAVEIKATREGSFDIHMIVSEAVRTGIAFLTSPGANATANLGAFVAIFWESVRLTKWLAGRRDVKKEIVGEGIIRLTLPDGTSIETPSGALTLATHSEVRRGIRGMLAPLESEGVEKFEVRDSEIRVSLTRADLPAFDAPDLPDEELEDETRTVMIQLRSAALAKDRRHWRATKGGEEFSVIMADDEFLEGVETRKILFGAGDMLRVEMRERQLRTATGLRMERTILRVIDHLDGGRQIPIDGWSDK